MLLGLLVYGYATGVFSSRKLERANYDLVAFRFIAANEHPDHDTIATFRRRFLAQIEALFVQVLLLAREMGVLKMGTVALDGTKIYANASRHSALSYEHAGKIEAQLKAEVADLMAKAEAADAADIPDGMSIPDELARREERLRKLAEARAKIAARAKERHAREQAEHEAKLAARQAKAETSGKKPRGKPPEPPVEGPRPNDQINLTDEELRIMPVAGGGFDQCYNAQAAVAAEAAGGGELREPGAQRQAATRTDAGQDRGSFRRTRQARMPAGGYRLFQRGERRGLRQGGDRTADRHGPTAASSAVGRALPSGAGSTQRSNAGRGDGVSAEYAGRPGALRAAQADPGAGVRDHQIDAGIPSVFAARPRGRARRMEPCHHRLEHQADVRPCPGRQGRARRLSRGPGNADLRPFTAFCTQPNARPAVPAKIIRDDQPQPPVRQAASSAFGRALRPRRYRRCR